MARLLEGKVAIVTGAAHGIGLAVARRFVDEGASVMMTDADEETVAAEARELDPEAKRVASFRCDPTERLDINNLMAASLDAFDHVDILVNSVSDTCLGDVLTLNEADFDRAINVNLKSAFLLTQLVARHLVERAGRDEKGKVAGSITHFSALHGVRSMPGRFLLGVAMAGLDQLTRGFAVALAPYGIRVNGIAPGGVAGRFAGLSDPEVRRTVVERTPMRRLGEPTELAATAVMLSSSYSSYITGQILNADGGRGIFEMPLPGAEDVQG